MNRASSPAQSMSNNAPAIRETIMGVQGQMKEGVVVPRSFRFVSERGFTAGSGEPGNINSDMGANVSRSRGRYGHGWSHAQVTGHSVRGSCDNAERSLHPCSQNPKKVPESNVASSENNWRTAWDPLAETNKEPRTAAGKGREARDKMKDPSFRCK
jgi:hypothetical protein